MNKVDQMLPKQTIILDWYDGIITAMIQFVNVEGWYLIDLQAWDLDQKSKVYLLTKLTKTHSNWILELFRGQKPSGTVWTPRSMSVDEFKELVDTINKIYIDIRDSSMMIFLAEDVNSGISPIIKETNNHNFYKADIDEILNMPKEEVKFWYSMF